MKNVYEVLRQKEMELTRLEKEVEALRLVAPSALGGKGDCLGHGETGIGNRGQRSTAPRIPAPGSPAMPAPQPFAPQDGKTPRSAGRNRVRFSLRRFLAPYGVSGVR